MLRESESAKGENSLVCCDIFSTTLSDTWLLHQSSKLERVYLKWHENRRSYQTYFFSPFVPKPSLPHKVDCSPEGWPLRAGDEKVFLLLLIASVCSRNNSSNRVLLFHFFPASSVWSTAALAQGEGDPSSSSSSAAMVKIMSFTTLAKVPSSVNSQSDSRNAVKVICLSQEKKFRGLRQLISPFSGGSFSLCSLPVFEFRQLCMSS